MPARCYGWLPAARQAGRRKSKSGGEAARYHV